MAIGLTQYLTVAAILFTIGVLGIFLNRKNIIIILMSVELILLAVNIKRQDVFKQTSRKRHEAIEVVEVKSGQGL